MRTTLMTVVLAASVALPSIAYAQLPDFGPAAIAGNSVQTGPVYTGRSSSRAFGYPAYRGGLEQRQRTYYKSVPAPFIPFW